MLALDLVYQYRKLLGKCESGLGLDVREMIELTELEDEGRRRSRVDVQGRLRGAPGVNDRVRVTALGPDGLVCRDAPYLEVGAQVEVVIDAGADLSYRFFARVDWLCEDAGDDFVVGLALVGLPLLVHYGPVDHVEDDVDRIAA